MAAVRLASFCFVKSNIINQFILLAGAVAFASTITGLIAVKQDWYVNLFVMFKNTIIYVSMLVLALFLVLVGW